MPIHSLFVSTSLFPQKIPLTQYLRPLIPLACQLNLFQSIVSSLNVTEIQPLAGPSRSLLEA
jgi:hypothetical protein